MSNNNTPDTLEIQLTRGQVTKISATDKDLADLKWMAYKHHTGTFYAHRNFPNPDWKNKKIIPLHRIILERKIGRPLEKGELCDHINGNSLDNTRENLRIANGRQNNQNAKRAKNNKSGYKGVHWRKDMEKWRSCIRVNGKLIHLGYFDDPKDGYKAYCEAAIMYFDDFARLE